MLELKHEHAKTESEAQVEGLASANKQLTAERQAIDAEHSKQVEKLSKQLKRLGEQLQAKDMEIESLRTISHS